METLGPADVVPSSSVIRMGNGCPFLVRLGVAGCLYRLLDVGSRWSLVAVVECGRLADLVGFDIRADDLESTSFTAVGILGRFVGPAIWGRVLRRRSNAGCVGWF